MTIRDFDPAKGCAFQGDVAIVPVPAAIAAKLNRGEEIQPVHGRLILQEGEVTGHHHAITLERPVSRREPLANPSLEVERLMSDALDGKIALPSARMFRDQAIAEAMRAAGILTRTDLCVGILSVEVGPMTVTHEEHDGIRLPIGCYYIGRQVESAGAEERRVAD